MTVSFRAIIVVLAVAAGGCAELGIGPMTVPEEVAVPDGHAEALRLAARGEVVYECRVRTAGGFHWSVLSPSATLFDASGASVGRYFGGPVWELKDGSRVTGQQIAVARTGPGGGAIQLVKATAGTAKGRLAGVTYIQRLNTRGGSAPDGNCSEANAGVRRTVPYEAEYAFYRPQRVAR